MASFDRIVLDSTIKLLEGTQDRLKTQGLANPRLTVERALENVRTIRENDSLRPKYEDMFNQCAVLLVSHFTSALTELFRNAVPAIAERHASLPILDEDVKLSLREVLALQHDPYYALGDLILRKREISFQDMQSTFRAFRDCTGVEPKRTVDVSNIIVGQAARHVIVHNGAVVNDVCINRTAKARQNYTLDLALEDGVAVQFRPQSLGQLGASMSRFLGDLAECLDAKLNEAV